eukprot:gene189-327_t
MNLLDVHAAQMIPMMTPVSSGDSMLYACVERTLKALLEERTSQNSNRKRLLLESKVDAFKRKLSRADADREVLGDRYLKDVHTCLDSFGMERTNSQKQFHKAFLGATLAHIYGAVDFERHRTRILAQNNLSDPSFEVLVVTPRRWGKTTSVAMFVAALLLSVADMWVSVFSTGQRASSSLLEQPSFARVRRIIALRYVGDDDKKCAVEIASMMSVK